MVKIELRCPSCEKPLQIKEWKSPDEKGGPKRDYRWAVYQCSHCPSHGAVSDLGYEFFDASGI